jgi:hypothetical protein
MERAMRAKWPFLAVILGLGLGYVAYPYVTLYRLGVAIRGADAATLHTLVDWPAVREGIKEDICDYVADDSQDRQASAQLPAFGASFVRGITANAVDQNVTPEALVEAVRPASTAQTTRTAPPPGADVHVGWAFFESPTIFQVNLRAPGQAEPIKLEMDLRGGRWQVRRVWLPRELLEHANPRA